MYNSRNSAAHVVETEFAKWRTFRIGGMTRKEALLVRVREVSLVDGRAEHLMKDCEAFTTQDREEEIETIILAPADFSYECMPTITELLDPARLNKWSQQNARRLPEGHVVELLPAEAGPQIRDQYEDQPENEILRIAMERIIAQNGFSYIFVVKRGEDGVRVLSTSWASPVGQWNLDAKFVYWLRRVAI